MVGGEFLGSSSLREIATVESGKDEGKTKKAVEKVCEGQMKDQDRFVCVQVWNVTRVPGFTRIEI